jgi:putative chitinase
MYERVGQRLDIDLVANPHLVITPDYALPAACEVWRMANGNALADHNDVVRLTRALTGNNHGLASRWAWLGKTRAIWPQH